MCVEDAIGVRVSGPGATFSIVRDSLGPRGSAEEGFAYDSSIFPIHHDRYGIPDASRFPHRVQLPGGGHIAEFPITTLPIAGQRLPFSGGGYFRLLPYPAIRMALKRVNTGEGMPALVYLHPWEMDPEQPRLSLRGISRFRQYVNLRYTAGKLDRLLADFTFAPAGQLLRESGLTAAAS